MSEVLASAAHRGADAGTLRSAALRVLGDEELVNALEVHACYMKNACISGYALMLWAEGERHEPAATIYSQITALETLDGMTEAAAWKLVLCKVREKLFEAWRRIKRGEPTGYPLESIDRQIAEWCEPEKKGA